MSFWFDPQKRLSVAKQLQQKRIEYLQCIWGKDRDLHYEGFNSNDSDIKNGLTKSLTAIDNCNNVTDLLLKNAKITKFNFGYV